VLTATGGKQVISVTLVVTPSRRVAFDKTPSQLSFTLKPRGKAPDQLMRISHVGDGNLSWRLIASTFNGANFLKISTDGGVGPTRVSIGVTSENLPGCGAIPGVYTGQLLFLSENSMVTVPVAVRVSDGDEQSWTPRTPIARASTTVGATNLFQSNTQNAFCGGFQSFGTGYGGLLQRQTATTPDN
jgi:hypothetical protein